MSGQNTKSVEKKHTRALKTKTWTQFVAVSAGKAQGSIQRPSREASSSHS
jgi:hypothetical protein